MGIVAAVLMSFYSSMKSVIADWDSGIARPNHAVVMKDIGQMEIIAENVMKIARNVVERNKMNAQNAISPKF